MTRKSVLQSGVRSTGCGRQHGFTLVELLVVIGIIALLISILLPALNRVRASSTAVQCQSNLRQLGVALRIYAGSYKDVMPPGFVSTTPTGTALPGGGTHWVLLLQNAINNRYGANWNDASATNANSADIRDLFFCPDAPGARDKAMNASGTTHFASHPVLMPFMFGQGGQYEFYGTGELWKISKVKRPSEVALIWDSTLVFNTTDQVWQPANQVPVSINIDRFGISRNNNRGLNATTYMDGSTQLNPNGSIEMQPNITGQLSLPFATYVNTDTPQNAHNFRFRHFRDTTLNTLMVDGHVESFRFDKRKPLNSPVVTTLLRRNVYVNR